MPNPYRPLPFDNRASEDRIWEAAGITQADRAGMLAHAFDRTGEALDASVVKVFQYQGEVYYSIPLVDHDTRLRASKQSNSGSRLAPNTLMCRSPRYSVKTSTTSLPIFSASE